MGLFTKLYGSQEFDSQKNKKFQDLDNQNKDQEMILFDKVTWLTSRGNNYNQRGKNKQFSFH